MMSGRYFKQFSAAQRVINAYSLNLRSYLHMVSVVVLYDCIGPLKCLIILFRLTYLSAFLIYSLKCLKLEIASDSCVYVSDRSPLCIWLPAKYVEFHQASKAVTFTV